MRRFRKATIKEVAQKAGVSITTVSIFVSGREDVCSLATAERIRTAVAELNYTPSSLVSGMQTRITTTIGVCMFSPLDDIAYGGLFYERLWRGILYQANQENYSVLHYPDSVRESSRCDAFLDGRVDGILFHAHTYENERPARIAAAGMPIVLLARSLKLPDGCGAVYVEEMQAVDRALSHLWDLGHRRIAHVAGPVGRVPSWDEDTDWGDDPAIRRLEAYVSWMESRNIADPDLIGYAREWQARYVPEIVAAWARLPEPPTAVFCANDALAIGVIAAASQLGWRVPEDLSVVGVDNSGAALDFDIPLTSVEVPIESVGREGMRVLLRLMQGAPLEECRIALPSSEIFVRSSTARYAGRHM